MYVGGVVERESFEEEDGRECCIHDIRCYFVFGEAVCRREEYAVVISFDDVDDLVVCDTRVVKAVGLFFVASVADAGGHVHHCFSFEYAEDVDLTRLFCFRFLLAAGVIFVAGQNDVADGQIRRSEWSLDI